MKPNVQECGRKPRLFLASHAKHGRQLDSDFVMLGWFRVKIEYSEKYAKKISLKKHELPGSTLFLTRNVSPRWFGGWRASLTFQIFFYPSDRVCDRGSSEYRANKRQPAHLTKFTVKRTATIGTCFPRRATRQYVEEELIMPFVASCISKFWQLAHAYLRKKMSGPTFRNHHYYYHYYYSYHY